MKRELNFELQSILKSEQRAKVTPLGDSNLFGSRFKVHVQNTNFYLHRYFDNGAVVFTGLAVKTDSLKAQ